MRLTQEQPPWQDGVPASALQASSAPFDEMKKAPLEAYHAGLDPASMTSTAFAQATMDCGSSPQ
jgi:hypothetical protein